MRIVNRFSKGVVNSSAILASWATATLLEYKDKLTPTPGSLCKSTLAVTDSNPSPRYHVLRHTGHSIICTAKIAISTKAPEIVAPMEILLNYSSTFFN